MTTKDALTALLEECGRERTRLAMERADLARQNDEMRQLLQVALCWLPYARGNARLDGDEAAEVDTLMQRIAALGGRRA